MAKYTEKARVWDARKVEADGNGVDSSGKAYGAGDYVLTCTRTGEQRAVTAGELKAAYQAAAEPKPRPAKAAKAVK